MLSDPAQRADSTGACPRHGSPAPPGRRPRIGRYAVALVAVLALAGLIALVAATRRQSVGDGCLVAWRGEAFEVPFRGVVDGREITAPLRGGAGGGLAVHADGRSGSTTGAPLR